MSPGQHGQVLDFLTAEDRANDLGICCSGAAMTDVDGCYCWEPVYDLEQAAPRPDVEPVTRAKACDDCAFRKGSPERERGDDLEGLPGFWCHQGIRRPKAWRHPDGRVRIVEVATSPDYQPPIVAHIPYRANGQPADRCGGWQATVGRRR